MPHKRTPQPLSRARKPPVAELRDLTPTRTVYVPPGAYGLEDGQEQHVTNSLGERLRVIATSDAIKMGAGRRPKRE